MSLRYRIFGVVKSLDDYAAKLQRNGEKDVNIQIDEIRDDNFFLHGYDVNIQTSSMKKRAATFSVSPFPAMFGAGGPGKLFAESKTLKYTMMALRIMRSSGLNPTINNSPADEYIAQQREYVLEGTKRVTELSSMFK